MAASAPSRLSLRSEVDLRPTMPEPHRQGPTRGHPGPVSAGTDDLETEGRGSAVPVERPDSLILIVDDDPLIRETVGQILRDEGYETVEACDGADALTYLESAPHLPGLVVLDLMMPVMNGWDFHARVRTNPRFDPIPILVVSASASELRRARSTENTFALGKPFDLDDLLTWVERLGGPPNALPESGAMVCPPAPLVAK